MNLAVDHAVINVLRRMDTAVPRFRELGFTLTPRGYHSLGSINHLMVFGRDYLELVGLPDGDGPVRREVADSPLGLNGLVFATADAETLHRDLARRGIAAQPPLTFDRPVEVDGMLRKASFRTVRLDGDWVHGGRVYFCQHETPELVWRTAWQVHRNGVYALAGMTIAVPDPRREAVRYT
ncbi:MAG: VOC family protein, partial [Casimicrobiaceae bacterium]